MACLPTDRSLWVVNPDNSTASRLDADSLAVELEVPTCSDPRSVAIAASGDIWIACFGDDRIQVLDGASGAEVGSLPTGYGSAPIQIVVAPSGSTAYAALSGSGQVRRYDTATRTESGSLTLGPSPRALAVTSNGARLLVTRFLSPRNHAEVWDVDTTSMTLLDTIELRKFGGSENRDTTASGRGVANYLVSIAITPDGDSAWIAATKPNNERGLLFGPDLDQDNTVRSIALQIDLATNEMVHAIDLDNSDSPSAIANSAFGDYLFIALQGNDEIVVLDGLEAGTVSGLGSLVTRLGSDAAPQGLCLDAPGERLMTKNLMGRSVTALDLSDLLHEGSPIAASQATLTVSSEVLPAEVRLGKQIFYAAGDARMSAEGYLSCATCHLDGGHDGRVSDFTGRGEGLRNTTDLRGRGGTDHGNVHWSANFDEIQDFENDIRGAFGGTGFLSDSDFAATEAPLGPIKAGLSPDLDALSAYVSSLGPESLPRSPFRTPAGELTTEGLAGQELFQSLGCGGCHRGSRFTDSALGSSALLHDVGTLRTTSGERLGGPLEGIDTPTLNGLWDTAPYFHDGSAPTLESVFQIAGGFVVPAESSSPSAGATIIDNYVNLNNDDTVHGRAYADINDQGASLTFTAVDGGSGGTGAIEVRHSNSGVRTLEISVNGGPSLPLTLLDGGNDPGWRRTNWLYARREGVALSAGPTNTVIFSSNDAFPNLSLDEIIVSTADNLARATPHRQVLNLSASDRADLIAYLNQLDGQLEANPDPTLFTDGFESGDLTAWD